MLGDDDKASKLESELTMTPQINQSNPRRQAGTSRFTTSAAATDGHLKSPE
jgi:hypothetical protein